MKSVPKARHISAANTIRWRSEGSSILPAISIFARELCYASASTIRHLDLNLLWNHSSVLEAFSTVQLPLLSFVIQVGQPHETAIITKESVDSLLEILFSLLEAHFPGLQRLDLLFYTHVGDFPNFYRRLVDLDISKLENLGLTGPFTDRSLPDSGQAIENVIFSHRMHLQSLVLRPLLPYRKYIPEYSFHVSEPPQNIYWHLLGRPPVFPQLRRLELALLQSQDFQVALSCIRAFFSSARHTLEDVTLNGKYLSSGEVEQVLDNLDQTLAAGACAQLRRLSIHIRALTPNTIDMLASRLSRLEVLRIKIVEVKPLVPTKEKKVGGFSPLLAC
jgi:hypothetical protein